MATCNSGGADEWEDHYAAWLQGHGGFLTSASLLPGIHADQLTANNYPNHPELFEKIHLVAPEQHPPAAVHLNAEPLG